MFEKVKEKMAGAKVRLGLLVSSGLMLVGTAAAADVNWTEITAILEGVVNIFPSILTLVVNVFPIVIVLAIITFVTGFLDRILNMVKI